MGVRVSRRTVSTLSSCLEPRPMHNVSLHKCLNTIQTAAYRDDRWRVRELRTSRLAVLGVHSIRALIRMCLKQVDISTSRAFKG